MTPDERKKVEALAMCTFLPGSYPKRFVRDMSTLPEDYILTFKQEAYLLKLYWQYRRQINKLREKGWNFALPIEPIEEQL